MRNEMQNAATRELTAEELSLVGGGSLWDYVVGAAVGGFMLSAAIDGARKNEMENGMKPTN